MTSTGPIVYVQIHDGAFEDQEECPSNRDRSYNMPLEEWDIDTLDPSHAERTRRQQRLVS